MKTRAMWTMGCAAMWSAAVVAAGSNPRDWAPRGEYAAPSPVVDTAGMGAWLTRLRGRYGVDGMVEVVLDHPDFHAHRCGAVDSDEERFCQNITGQADCTTIGKGPGVQCIIQASWPDMFFIVNEPPDPDRRPRPPPPGIYNLPGGNPFLAPAVLMIGMDPNKAGLGFLLVDNKGLPEGGAGSILGDRGTLRSPCVNGPVLLNGMRQDVINSRPPRSCERILHIHAKQDSSVVNLAFDIRINDETYTRIDITLRRRQGPPAVSGVTGLR